MPFTPYSVRKTGIRFLIDVEEKRSAVKFEEARRTGDVAVIPIGALPEGDYEVEVSFRAEPQDRAFQRRPRGVPRCLFTFGKIASPRLVEVSEVIVGGAWRSFHRNGWTDAGHSSKGRDQPMVHLENGWAPREEIDGIWKAALALDTDALERKYGAEAGSRYVGLTSSLRMGFEKRKVFP